MNPKGPTPDAARTETISDGGSLLNRVLFGLPDAESRITHVTELPARAARTSGWPSWAAPEVVDALRESGVEAPWTHQIRTAELAAEGTHVVVCTGTASGKSLGYQLPVLTELRRDPRATALY